MKNSSIVTKLNRKTLLSTIWIFVVLNYLYCDVLGLMDSGMLAQLLSGNIDGMHITQIFLLGSAILMEISMSMVLLSRILPYKANRIANIIAGLITTVVQIITLFVGTTTIYYIFFSIIEITGTAAAFWLALRWKNELE